MSSAWPVLMAGARLRFSPFPLPPAQPESATVYLLPLVWLSLWKLLKPSVVQREC
ncbi:TPA: hypothetical protein ACNFOY_002384 [Enterobacter chuandaensis]